MNEFIGKNKVKLVVLALAVVMLITSASYAWFTATVSGDGNENVVTTGNMEITFEDGQVIKPSMVGLSKNSNFRNWMPHMKNVVKKDRDWVKQKQIFAVVPKQK